MPRMEYRQLGRTGCRVSSLCLGAMTFGEPTEGSFMHMVAADEQTSFQIMDRAREAGINFIDTANVYGNDGLSERVVGKWLRERNARDATVLATKFRFTMGEGPNDKGASRYHILRQVEASLKRLGTDRIDLYQIHMQDATTPEEETLRALDDLVRQGKVLYIGASNYAAYRLVNSLWLSKARNLESFVVLQAQYSLISRQLERELAPACREFGLGILPWSPLGAGFLTGKYKRGQRQPEGSRLSKWESSYQRTASERNFAIVDACEDIARVHAVSVPQVALAWLLAQPHVTAPIIGARTLAQLEDNLKSTALKLGAPELAKLDAVSKLDDLGYPYEFIRNISGSW